MTGARPIADAPAKAATAVAVTVKPVSPKRVATLASSSGKARPGSSRGAVKAKVAGATAQDMEPPQNKRRQLGRRKSDEVIDRAASQRFGHMTKAELETK